MPMTVEERRMLRELHDALLSPRPDTGRPLLDELKELHEAFLEVPPGSPTDARPLLVRVNSVVALHERASWAMRALVYIFAGIGTIAGGIVAIRGFWGFWR